MVFENSSCSWKRSFSFTSCRKSLINAFDQQLRIILFFMKLYGFLARMMPEMASREPPVGSSDSDSYHDTIVLNQPKSDPDQYRVKQLEEERDSLQKNMISLTSRLAQVNP